MKQLSIFLTFFVVLTLYSFTNFDVFDDIALAIKSANSKEVARYFSPRVELKINDKENIYSKSQAEIILKDFFIKNPPLNFTIRHKGASAKGLPYIIGDLKTSNGNYRTYFLFKEVNNKLYIQELQFDKE